MAADTATGGDPVCDYSRPGDTPYDRQRRNAGPRRRARFRAAPPVTRTWEGVGNQEDASRDVCIGKIQR